MTATPILLFSVGSSLYEDPVCPAGRPRAGSNLMHSEHQDRLPTIDPLATLDTDDDFDPLYVGVLRRIAQREADETGCTYEAVAGRLARIVLASNAIREAGRRTRLDP